MALTPDQRRRLDDARATDLTYRTIMIRHQGVKAHLNALRAIRELEPLEDAPEQREISPDTTVGELADMIPNPGDTIHWGGFKITMMGHIREET